MWQRNHGSIPWKVSGRSFDNGGDAGEVLAEMKKEMIPWYVSRICGTDL